MFKVYASDAADVKRYLSNMTRTVQLCAAKKLDKLHATSKAEINAKTFNEEGPTAAFIETLYNRRDLDNIIDLIKFLQTASENELAAFVVLYGDTLNLIEKDIYNNWKEGRK